MRKIAILNFKGGTGKTTTAVNLSYALSLKNYKVLIIDCDPQGAIGSWLGLNPENTLYNLLTDEARLEDYIYPARSKLDIIASNKYLARIEFKLTKEEEIEKAFSKKLKTGFTDFGLILNNFPFFILFI